MRLLRTKTNLPEFEEFGDSDIPLYAILSHTWGDDEVSFQDIQCGNTVGKAGYEKVTNACFIAAAHGFNYVWIDTCCIDKTSSTELSEAINSMYRWYEGSGMCYVYLADVSPNAVGGQIMVVDDQLAKSRWFTRGWTLQELIAPSMMIFLNQAWQEIGTKSNLQTIISEITGIPDAILRKANLESASVAQRMSWASNRKTTRLEDIAYCLMGIFGVNMPMLYGEGEKAFLRLQEEIIKVSDDHSLFAWGHTMNWDNPFANSLLSGRYGLLATSPAAFANSGNIVPLDSSTTLAGDITVNNKGIHLKVRFENASEVGSRKLLALLPCTVKGRGGSAVGVYLEDVSGTKEYFARVSADLVMYEGILMKAEGLERRICVRRERLTRRSQLPLARASERGNETVAITLLEKGALPDSASLSKAARNGHEAVVRLLLEKGARPDSASLSEAVQNGHEAVVRLLLEKGTLPDSTSLFNAAWNGHEAVVRLLLEKGGLLDRESIALNAAAYNGHEAVVRLFLEKGDRPDSASLSKAARNGHEAVVRLLLEKGARPDSVSLSEAARNGYEAVVRLLLEKGARPDSTCLSEAAWNGHDVVLRLLLEKTT